MLCTLPLLCTEHRLESAIRFMTPGTAFRKETSKQLCKDPQLGIFHIASTCIATFLTVPPGLTNQRMGSQDNCIYPSSSTHGQSNPPPSRQPSQIRAISLRIPIRGSCSDQRKLGNGSSVKQRGQEDLPSQNVSGWFASRDGQKVSNSTDAVIPQKVGLRKQLQRILDETAMLCNLVGIAFPFPCGIFAEASCVVVRDYVEQLSRREELQRREERFTTTNQEAWIEATKYEAPCEVRRKRQWESKCDRPSLKLQRSPSASTIPSQPSDGELSFIATQDSDQGSLGNSEDARNDLVEIQSMLVAGMFHEYVNAARECGFRSRGHTESRAGSSLVTEPPSRRLSSTATLQSAVSRGKRARANSDDEDDGSDRRKGTRKQQFYPDSEYAAKKVFACPFSKHDPSRYSERNTVEKNYRGCSSCFLTDIPRVKQHLYRKHKRPDHYCGSCFQIFEIQEALDTHSRQRPACEVAEPRFAEKMTRDQLNNIKRRSPGKDACETWFNIFRILFPGAALPDSPFYEAASPMTVQSFLAALSGPCPSHAVGVSEDSHSGSCADYRPRTANPRQCA